MEHGELEIGQTKVVLRSTKGNSSGGGLGRPLPSGRTKDVKNCFKIVHLKAPWSSEGELEVGGAFLVVLGWFSTRPVSVGCYYSLEQLRTSRLLLKWRKTAEFWVKTSLGDLQRLVSQFGVVAIRWARGSDEVTRTEFGLSLRVTLMVIRVKPYGIGTGVRWV